MSALTFYLFILPRRRWREHIIVCFLMVSPSRKPGHHDRVLYCASMSFKMTRAYALYVPTDRCTLVAGSTLQEKEKATWSCRNVSNFQNSAVSSTFSTAQILQRKCCKWRDRIRKLERTAHCKWGSACVASPIQRRRKYRWLEFTVVCRWTRLTVLRRKYAKSGLTSPLLPSHYRPQNYLGPSV